MERVSFWTAVSIAASCCPSLASSVWNASRRLGPGAGPLPPPPLSRIGPFVPAHEHTRASASNAHRWRMKDSPCHAELYAPRREGDRMVRGFAVLETDDA